MSAFDFFDKVYVVHLPNAERRKKIDEQLARIGRAATFVHADKPPQEFSMSNMRRAPGPEFGVNLSHIKAVVAAIQDRASCPLFLEDDVQFRDDADSLFYEVLFELPEAWDVLYLGGHPREKATRAGGHLAKVGKFSFAEAYSVHHTALPDLFAYWCNRIAKPHAMYDFILGEFAARRKAYCVYPLLTQQPPNVSQVSGKQDDKRALIERGWATNLVA